MVKRLVAGIAVGLGLLVLGAGPALAFQTGPFSLNDLDFINAQEQLAQAQLNAQARAEFANELAANPALAAPCPTVMKLPALRINDCRAGAVPVSFQPAATTSNAPRQLPQTGGPEDLLAATGLASIGLGGFLRRRIPLLFGR